MRHHLIVVVGGLALAAASGVAAANAQDADPIGERVETARTAYVEEAEKLRAVLLESLAKREDAARNTGKKPLVDHAGKNQIGYSIAGALIGPKAAPNAP